MNRLGLNQISTAGADATNDTPRFNPATGRVEYAPVASASPTQVVREGFAAAAGDDLLTLGGTPVAGTPYVWVGGALLWPGIHYTLDGNVITLNAPLTGGESVWLSFETSDTPVPSTLGQAAGGSFADLMAAETNLMAWWRLGETSGTTASDSSGNGRHATYQNSPTLGVTGLISGDSDKAMQVSVDSGQCATIAAAAWMNVSQLTVEAVIKFSSAVDATNGDAIVSRYGTFNWLLYRDMGGKLSAQLSNAAGATKTLTGTVTPTNGTTYHVAMAYDGTTLDLRVNGAAAGSLGSMGGGIWTGASPIEIGRYSASSATTPGAVIDEVAIHSIRVPDARLDARAALIAP